jgi:hypothetical protein
MRSPVEAVFLQEVDVLVGHQAGQARQAADVMALPQRQLALVYAGGEALHIGADEQAPMEAVPPEVQRPMTK